MYPTLFSISGIPFATFGVFIAVALIVGAFCFWRFSRLVIRSSDTIFDTLFVSIVGAFLGGRLLYILLHLHQFWPHLFLTLDVFHVPGFVYYGVLMGGGIAVYGFCRWQKLAAAVVFDRAVLSVSIAHAIGLVGAFFAGSAYGSATNSLLGVPMVGMVGNRYPVQLFEAVAECFIFLLLWHTYKRRHQPGTVAITYLMMYPLVRIAIEFFRGDSVYLGFVKTQWLLSLLVLGAAIAIYFWRFPKKWRNQA